MNKDETAVELLFGIQRSVRYHDHRIAHFDILHKITNVLTILLSGIVILELSGRDSPPWIKFLAAFSAVMSAFDLVVGYGHRANQHRDFKRRYCALERELGRVNSQFDIEGIRGERLAIEAEEPPIFRALDAMCHNELLTAHGYSRLDDEEKSHYRQLPRFKQWTANWLRWPNMSSTTHCCLLYTSDAADE